MALAKQLTPQSILEWAGERSYQRGEDYFRAGLVGLLDNLDDRITATVHGTRPYRVTLWDDDGLRFACDCPVGLGGTFCKHCVAVAPAWMAEETESGGAEGGEPARASTGKTGPNRHDLRDWLVLQEVQEVGIIGV